MKRKSISDYFAVTPAKREVIEDCPSASGESSSNPDGMSTPDSNPGMELENPSTGESGQPISASAASECFWPTCWTVEQKNDHLQKNDWLFFNAGKLGCSVCKNVGASETEKTTVGMRLSKEWIRGEVSFNGELRKQQLTSLRKKIFEHRESAGHKAAVRITAEAREESKAVCLWAQEREVKITKKVFRTAYNVARKNQPFSDFEADIDLLELNGVDVGTILHSAASCAHIVDHIGSEMRSTLIEKILDSKSKLSLILDESTTVGRESVLIVYLRAYIEKVRMEDPVDHFISLIELDDVTADGIFKSLMSALESLRITEEVLKESLVSLTCDGAAMTMGSHEGVAKLFKDRFPSIIVWPCASHRLELSVHDAVKEVCGVNRFKSFIDKLYVLYRSSPKNAGELKARAATLEVEISKIGRILSSRWVASRYRTVMAVWKDYEALVLHFEKGKTASGRDRKEKRAYESLLEKITSAEFVLDLGLLSDALQELSELRVDLQERTADLYTAQSKIESLVEICGKRGTAPGPYYTEALEATGKLQFKGVQLHRRDRTDEPPISPVAFYEQLKKLLQKRLLSKDDAELSRCGSVLESKNWPANSSDRILYGEGEISRLARRFQLNERKAIRAFREHLKYGEEMSEELSSIRRILNTVAVSSSECERGFSEMNLIVTPERSSLKVKTITSLLFIRIVGPPLKLFDPTKFVRTWLLQGHRSASDTQSKTRKRVEESDVRMTLWKALCS
ncbi:PREDICTED: uncharacterized protein KIAA1586-like [Gekko japonicus]|uniref:Uncharacterized protein KIAA1586-like n=1 Tax=Gekko japonicus TaxID=146911 RepID=A0ABM1KTT5_GEKJA|nr:PREDICTED: uncharacterized protein KIAA1586-like [Gekko japonicus]